MKPLFFFCVLAIGLLTGCGNKEPPKDQVTKKSSVNVGDSYEDVIDKLGRPNLETVSQNSRVLIYDRVELKLQSNMVVMVYDHRGK